jgi:hypothetical protein
MTTIASIQSDDAPFLNVRDTSFSIRSADVAAAREKSWYARTPYGLAALRCVALR